MDREDDRAAIMAVLRAETEAWLRRDFAAMAQHWVQSEQTRRMVAFASLGASVDIGWDAIAARLEGTMRRFPGTYDYEERLTLERLNVVVAGDMAWVTYDQVGSDTGDDFELAGVQHELKIFHRIDGAWKIGCLVLMQRGIEHAACPLIEVDQKMRIRWTNAQARERLRDYPGLLASADHLRARRRDCEPALREAVAWAFAQLRDHPPPILAARLSRPVSLGEDEAAVPIFCWVLIDDGKVLVSFDDKVAMARRIESASEVYRLSPTQTRLARLIGDGQSLPEAATVLGVSVNTIRTHLQRMFDRTGAHNQATLMRTLLSADTPTR